MKKIIFLFLFLFFVFLFFRLFSKSSFDEIEINGKRFQVEISDTSDKRIKGLSNRESLDKGSGMLFVFEEPGIHRFWMKDMDFALDFIWIRENKIVEITPNVLPVDYQPPNTISPKTEVDKVLEINAKEAEEFGLKIGDEIKPLF
ncbi:MAG: DUF192 domain-containing protein [Patescibacteria group bacterium]|nr:DUF192 domain-containing protein [Patescibacteria group bacterium]